jgi:DNA-binding response OmpR family regulator
MIVEDEYDILLLYKDYLSGRGHQILATATTTGSIINDYETIHPDITLVDYKLPGNSSGLDLARQILQISPTAAILLITAYDSVTEEISKDPTFEDKRFAVLIKPTKLRILESTIYNLINKGTTIGR